MSKSIVSEKAGLPGNALQSECHECIAMRANPLITDDLVGTASSVCDALHFLMIAEAQNAPPNADFGRRILLDCCCSALKWHQEARS